MKASELNENPLKDLKKKADKAKKAVGGVLPGTRNAKDSIAPKTKPTEWDDVNGNLKSGTKVNFKGTDYEWSGSMWKNSTTGKALPTNSAAHAALMKSVGRKPNGTKLPEYPNILAKAKSWWDGDHGEFGIASRKEKDPFVKAMGLGGAAIDAAITRARKPKDSKDNDEEPTDPADRLAHRVNQSAPLEESGSVEGTGLIHLSEVEPTLAYLESKTGLDIQNNVLGSTGKKTWSGDIDVAMDASPGDIPEIINTLNNISGVEKVQRLPGNSITSRVKIQQYDASIENDDGRPRTGYVQVDFMVGEPGWMKTYYHSPAQGESRYKGVVRNIMLSAIAANYNQQVSDQQLDDGRPLVVERYKFGNNGLVRIRRTPKPKKNGDGYTKANIDEVIEGPWKDSAEIVRLLDLGDTSVLNSFETLLKAIEGRYDRETVYRIKEELRNNQLLKEIGIPEELNQ
jgi:hypothetical protein